ncbi:hypothetical protein AB0B25_29990 [Nocardia sp. NPDC049190]|uniref:hypothetical protein n=1 Tax=Nocardia sp. NPDC049190 TaxID=3155650 RepID=UPI0033D6CF40
MATRVFAEEELERLRGFPEISREEWCVLTADPDVEADIPVHLVDGWPYGTVRVRPDGFVSRSYG